jgi:hypothetical protein
VRSIGYWLTGIGLLQLGHALVRVLVGFVPLQFHHRDPPFWTIGLQATACVLLWIAGRGVRDGRPWARAAGIAWIALWIAATFLSVNTETMDPLNQSVEAARAGSWRAAGWPSMLGHLDDFSWRASEAWAPPAVVAMGSTIAFGLALIGVLAKPLAVSSAESGEPQTPEARDLRRRRVLDRAEANPSAAMSVIGALIAIHLATIAILTVIAMIGLANRFANHVH